MPDDIKTAVTAALGELGLSGGAGEGNPPAAEQQHQQQSQAAQSSAIDYDRIINGVADRLKGGESKPKTFAELLNAGAGAEGQQPTVAAGVGTVRKVPQFEQDGLVDVFSLSDQELDQLGPERVVELYEKAKHAARRQSGRPQRPAALRNGPRRQR